MNLQAPPCPATLPTTNREDLRPALLSLPPSPVALTVGTFCPTWPYFWLHRAQMWGWIPLQYNTYCPTGTWWGGRQQSVLWFYSAPKMRFSEAPGCSHCAQRCSLLDYFSFQEESYFKSLHGWSCSEIQMKANTESHSRETTIPPERKNPSKEKKMKRELYFK